MKILKSIATALKFLAALIIDPRTANLSLGRVAFWLVLIVSLCRYQQFNPTWATTLLILAGYNTASKLIKTGS